MNNIQTKKQIQLGSFMPLIVGLLLIVGGYTSLYSRMTRPLDSRSDISTQFLAAQNAHIGHTR